LAVVQHDGADSGGSGQDQLHDQIPDAGVLEDHGDLDVFYRGHIAHVGDKTARLVVLDLDGLNGGMERRVAGCRGYGKLDRAAKPWSGLPLRRLVDWATNFYVVRHQNEIRLPTP
jgi:hypothetical protein